MPRFGARSGLNLQPGQSMFRYAFATLSLYPLCAEYVSMAWALVGMTWDYLFSMLFGIDVRFSASGRIEVVDSMRGVLLYWMLVSHSLQHAGVPMAHPLQWLRPYGWMSSSFVMLTGTALALIYAQSKRDLSFITNKIFARIVQVLLIAFVTNALSVAWRERSVSAAWETTFFQVPWSISQYLLPTALMMMLTPLLLFVIRKYSLKLSLVVFASAVFALHGAISLWISLSPDSVFIATIVGDSNLFEVSLFCFTSASVVAFCFGLLFLRRKIDWEGWFYITGLSSLYVASDAVLLSVLDGSTRIIYETGLYAARFVLILQLTHVLLLMRNWAPVRQFLRLSGSFGKNSLFVFIFHRPICQLTGAAAGRMTAAVELRLFVIVGVTIGVLMATARARRMIRVFDRTLTTIGF